MFILNDVLIALLLVIDTYQVRLIQEHLLLVFSRCAIYGASGVVAGGWFMCRGAWVLAGLTGYPPSRVRRVGLIAVLV